MTELKRLPNWRARFADFVDEVRLRPFDWSTQHDCAIGLCGRFIQALTGHDLVKQWVGRYTTRTGAVRALRRAGFDDLADAVAAHLPEIHPSQARVGDIAAFRVDSPFGWALGIVNGERVLVMREEGLGSMNLLDAERAFKVG